MSDQTLNGDGNKQKHQVCIMRLTNPPPDDSTIIEVAAVCTCGWRQSIPSLSLEEAFMAGNIHAIASPRTTPVPSNAPLAPASPQERVEKIKKEDAQ